MVGAADSAKLSSEEVSLELCSISSGCTIYIYIIKLIPCHRSLLNGANSLIHRGEANFCVRETLLKCSRGLGELANRRHHIIHVRGGGE